MNILVRLPNWLGDLVMSSACISSLKTFLPECTIDVIVKDSLVQMVPFLGGIRHVFPFSNTKYPGLRGAIRFGREIASKSTYDIFFCLPDSFSSALIGYFCGPKVRIGYAAQFRSILLTKAYKKSSSIHRVEEYLHLCSSFFNFPEFTPDVRLESPVQQTRESLFGSTSKPVVLLNCNSEAPSRRMPAALAVSLVNFCIQKKDGIVVLSGSKKDESYTKQISDLVGANERLIDKAGKTTLRELVELCSSADLVISTDSGIAHLANALFKPVIVLFGAGNEQNTAPFNKKNLQIVRAPEISCAPCISNTCKFDHVRCMNEISEEPVINLIENSLKNVHNW